MAVFKSTVFSTTVYYTGEYTEPPVVTVTFDFITFARYRGRR